MRTTLRLLFVGALGLTAACQDAVEPNAPSDESLHAVAGAAGSVVAGQYIVVFRDDVADAPGLARRLTQAHGVAPMHTYQHAMKGFAARLPEPAVEALRRNPNVAYVEQDQVVTAIGTQSPATWGLDRVDQRETPLNNTYTYGPTGSGVKVYIIDTGIRTTHNDFGGRAVSGFDAVDGGAADDCNGHGTHVAGTVGGATYGVAKAVDLVAVRVLDCQGRGTNSGVIAGIEWVTTNHTSGPAVANMSLGGGASSALDDAVRASISDGVVYALAAGNGDFIGRPQNACNYSPARVTQGITVGSTTSSDNESSFSNYGTCVDILAPGSGITSAWYNSNTATNTISGTSMATPHVAGAAALYLQGATGASPSTVASALVNNSTANTITLHSRSASNGTPNRLLYTAFMGGGGGGTPPVAGFTYSCTGLSCSFTNTSSGAASYNWNFGNGTTSTGTNPSVTYAASGDYSVSLTATNSSGSDSESQTVSVSSGGGGGGGIALSVNAYKVRGTKTADLTWSGAASTSVDVFRDNAKVVTTANDGAHSDNIGSKGGGSHVYRVCEAGTSTCSSNVTATF